MAIPPRWAMLLYALECTATGMKITVTTDVVCHIWMRWTNIYPQKHFDPFIIRGAEVGKRPRFCFVAYHDNEQAEAGDTLIHTFVKEPWANCEKRWFYFWGTVGGEDSPSETAIIYHQRVCPITLDFPAMGTSGYLQSNQPTYAAAHDALAGTVHDDLNNIITGQAKEGAEGFYVWRAGLFFDTSILPDTCQILSAKLLLRTIIGGKFSAINDADNYLWIVPGTDLNSSGLVPSDYFQLASQTTRLGQIDKWAWLAGGSGAWVEIDIDLTIPRISRLEPTCLGMRSTHDIDNIPDVGFIERNRYDYYAPKLAQTGWAFLRVTYLPVCPP